MKTIAQKAGEKAGKRFLQQQQKKVQVSPPYVQSGTSSSGKGKSTSGSSTTTGSTGKVTVSPPYVPNSTSSSGKGKSTSSSSSTTGSTGKVQVSPPFKPNSTSSSGKGKSTSGSSKTSGKNYNWQTDPVTGLVTISPLNLDYTPAAESSIIGKSSKGLASGEKAPAYSTYEEAAAAAEKLGEETRKKQRKYDRDYAWRDEPENAAGYDLAVWELKKATSARDKALEFMREHASERRPPRTSAWRVTPPSISKSWRSGRRSGRRKPPVPTRM